MTLTEARKLCRHAADLMERQASDLYITHRAPSGHWWLDGPALAAKAEHDDLFATAAKLRELAKPK